MREIAPGTPPAEGVIPLAVPDVGDVEQRYVSESLKSGWVTYGPFVERFEAEVAALVGAKHAVAVASGTAALHLALLTSGVGLGDEVLLPTLTFVSPANAIRYAGAFPIFLDAEQEYWQLDVEKLADFLARETDRTDNGLRNRATGRRVAAVLPVHVLGHPVDMDPLRAVAREYGLPIVEDAAEGFGASYRSHPVGTLGDVGCLSFNGNKIVTCAGGGMVVTDDAEVAERVRYLATQAKDDPLEYVHGAVGFNYRLSNLHAALGCAQLTRLPDFVAAKRRIAKRYAIRLADVAGITPMPEAPWAASTFWLYTVLVDECRYGLDSRALMRRLIERGIQARPLWQPLHRSPAHREAQAYRCEVAEALHARALSLPCSVSLSPDEQARIVEEIRNAR